MNAVGNVWVIGDFLAYPVLICFKAVVQVEAFKAVKETGGAVFVEFIQFFTAVVIQEKIPARRGYLEVMVAVIVDDMAEYFGIFHVIFGINGEAS